MAITEERKRRLDEKLGTKPKEAPAKAPTPLPAPPKPTPDIFYNQANRDFLIENAYHEWQAVKETALVRALKLRGFRPIKRDATGLDDIEEEIHRITFEQNVHFAGPIAGYSIGMVEMGTSRILITQERHPIAPKEGDFTAVWTLLNELFGKDLPYVLGWIRCGLSALRAGPPWRPGQLLAIAGKSGSGKSLFQYLFTEMIGGRVGRPWEYLTGEDNYTDSLVRAEHLLIEDETSATDHKSRKYIGQQIKNLLVNQAQELHAKFGNKCIVTPFWRITMTLNDDPDHLLCLPPIDEGMQDKIILLRCGKANFPYGEDDLEGRAKYWATLKSQLPGFLYWLARWKIPAKLKDHRYGVKAYQCPELLGEVEELSAHMRLLSLIDSLDIYPLTPEPWVGTSHQLESVLREKDKNREVERLLSYSSACGQYLSMLEKRLPNRVQSKRGGKRQRTWSIFREGTNEKNENS